MPERLPTSRQLTAGTPHSGQHHDFSFDFDQSTSQEAPGHAEPPTTAISTQVQDDEPFAHIAHPRKRAFLKAWVLMGNAADAAESLGEDRVKVWGWRMRDAEFEEACQSAKRGAAEVMEREMYRRAVKGVPRLKFGKDGKPLVDPRTGDYVIEYQYSDLLLIFALKAALPEQYRDTLEVRGRMLHIDMEKLPQDLVQRIAAGEHPMAVLAGQAGALKQGIERDEKT